MKLNFKIFSNVFIILIVQLLCSSVYANKYLKSLKNNDNISNKYNFQLAKVEQVIDGDTVYLRVGGEVIKTRLKNIDCMETSDIHRAYRQAYDNNLRIEEIIFQGKLAKNELNEIIKQNKNFVYFETLGIDKYGRMLANLYDKNFNNINEIMEKSNYCTTYIYKPE